MIAFIGLLIFVAAFIYFAVQGHEAAEAARAARFASVAPAIGFEERQVAPKPSVQATKWAQRGSKLRPIGMILEGDTFPGMDGDWKGVQCTIWEEVVSNDEGNTYRTQYRINAQIQGPPLAIRKKIGLFRQSAERDDPDSFRTLNIGRDRFAKLLGVHGTDEQALAEYLTEPMQWAIVGLANECSRVDISNHGIQVTAGRFTGDVEQITRRLDQLVLVYNAMHHHIEV